MVIKVPSYKNVKFQSSHLANITYIVRKVPKNYVKKTGISWGGGIKAVCDLGFTFLLGRMTDVHAPDIYRAHCKIKA